MSWKDLHLHVGGRDAFQWKLLQPSAVLCVNVRSMDFILHKTASELNPGEHQETSSRPGYLQGQRQADEVHHHLLVGQLHAEEAQQGEEGLVVLPPAAQLLAAQVDVPVELLSVLRREEGGAGVRDGPYTRRAANVNQRGSTENTPFS